MTLPQHHVGATGSLRRRYASVCRRDARARLRRHRDPSRRRHRSSVLKLPHHGSKTSSSPAFLQRVHPLIDVVSAGENNPYGHPAPETLARLGGDAVFRTDQNGDITISTDGKRVWVQTQR